MIICKVTGATSSSFLQQAVHVNSISKRMTALGQVHQRFVIAPNIEQLLEDVERTKRNGGKMQLDK